MTGSVTRAEAGVSSLEARPPVRVLFACTGNSARSQMAEALLRMRATEAGMPCVVASAGTAPVAVHPFTVAVIGEVGIDIAGAQSKHVERFLEESWDYVVTVCDHARESCPVIPGAAQSLHWSFPDPAAVEGSADERLAAFREARDAIGVAVRRFVERFEV